ncbi:MAG: septum formation initiator family protein [Treponema sp.]|jgi:cell division protein FtsB|nr:septum formation initiator family protein [Treponema sp.]
MRIFKYLMGLWTAVAVYSVFSVLAGPSGLSAYGQLEAERERQRANLRDLGAVNEMLENTKNGLLYDQDAVTVQARLLGYAAQDERFIRVVGLGTARNPHAAAGRVYYTADPEFISDKTIKIAALCAGLIAFALFFLLEKLKADGKE